MIIKNNKKCNIKINDKNIESYKRINTSDYIPELKQFEKNGIIFDSVEGNSDYIIFDFHKKRKDLSILDGRVTIYFKEDEKYTKEDILTMLELNLKGFYDENGK